MKCRRLVSGQKYFQRDVHSKKLQLNCYLSFFINHLPIFSRCVDELVLKK